MPQGFQGKYQNIVSTFKIGDPSPLRSQLIGIRVQEKTCLEGNFLEKIISLTHFDQ